MKFIIVKTAKTKTSLKTKPGIKSKTPTKKEGYTLIWQPNPEYNGGSKRRASFSASDDLEACKKVFEKLYGDNFEEYEQDDKPKTLQEYKDYFDDIVADGADAVIEIRTASGKTVYQSDWDFDEEEEEDWDD